MTGKNIYAQIETNRDELESFVQSARNGNWQYVECVYCGKLISILDADFSAGGGDPCCRNMGCKFG